MNPDQLKFKLTTVFEPAPEGGFTCHFEEWPEILSEGETVDEARGNVWDALEQVMAYHREEAKAKLGPTVLLAEGPLRARRELSAAYFFCLAAFSFSCSARSFASTSGDGS